MKKRLLLLTVLLLLTANYIYSQNPTFGSCTYGKMSDFLRYVYTGDIEKVKTSLKLGTNIKETISCSKRYGGIFIKMNALAIAAQKGNTTMAKCLIDNGFDVNEILFETRLGDGYKYLTRTAIAFAAEALDLNMVDFLLKHKAEPLGVYFAYEGFNESIPSLDFKCRLNKEVIRKRERMHLIIKRLLNAGADPSDRDLLVHISAGDYNELAKLLVQKGANVNCSIYQNDTPLMFASERGNYALVKLLLDNKADINFKGDVNNFNAFVQTLESRFHGNLSKTLKLLLERGSDIKNAEIEGLIYYIILGDDKNAIRLLNDPKYNIEKTDWLGHNALYWAAECGNLKIAEILISKKMKDDQRMYDHSALMRAVVNNDIEMAKLLIKSGSNVNYIDDNKLGIDFILTCAVENGNIEMVDLLLANGVDVNGGINANEWRAENIPLNKAVLNNDIEMTRKLLDHGANACWQFNKNGYHITLLTYARMNGDDNMFQLLKKHCILYMNENFIGKE